MNYSRSLIINHNLNHKVSKALVHASMMWLAPWARGILGKDIFARIARIDSRPDTARDRRYLIIAGRTKGDEAAIANRAWIACSYCAG
jgi:hypothetical protein